MQAGTLNRRVRLQQQGSSRDDFGQATTTWTDIATVWANILASNGKEAISAGRDVSEIMASIRIRYRNDVTAAMRVLHGTTIYNIKAVLPDEADRRFVDLVVATGANDG